MGAVEDHEFIRAERDRLEREVVEVAEEIAWLKTIAGPLLMMARLVPAIADVANKEAAKLGANPPFPPDAPAWLMVPASLRNWPTVDHLRRIAAEMGVHYCGQDRAVGRAEDAPGQNRTA